MMHTGLSGRVPILAAALIVLSLGAASPSRGQGDGHWSRRSLEIATALHEELAGRSFTFSPDSLRLVLCVLRDGARGETRAELSTLLGSDPVECRPEGMPAGPGASLVSANAVFLRQPARVALAFERRVARYGVEVKSVSGVSGGQAVDTWVSERTRGLIPTMLGTRALDADVVVLNALHFHASWQHPFDAKASRDAVFQGARGPRSVPFMTVTGSFAHRADERSEAVVLPYAGGAFQFEIVLPRQGAGASAADLLRTQPWPEKLGSLTARHGQVTIPRLKLDSRLRLETSLRRRGLKAAFEPGTADFTPMTQQGLRLALSRILQRVVLTADEAGTTAAAATAAEMVGALPPAFTLVADRPFLFAVRRVADGSLIFLGYVDLSAD